MFEERPQDANDRNEIGRFESDPIVGSDRQGAIMTYVYRKPRFLIAELMLDRKAATFNQAVYAINRRPPKCLNLKTPQEEFWGEVEC